LSDSPLANWWRDPAVVLATGFGSGFAPRAPGTAGTLVAVPVAALMLHWSLPWQLLLVAVVVVLGVLVCEHTSRLCGGGDEQVIVFDEIAGYLVAVIGLPPSLLWMALAFGVFRAFDILKPGPIRWIDRRVHGGIGIMLDDLAAGALAALVLQVGHYALG
jgi:phosphatidylglycerophosphatase A